MIQQSAKVLQIKYYEALQFIIFTKFFADTRDDVLLKSPDLFSLMDELTD